MSFSEQLPEREEWMHLADIVPGSFINTTEIPQPNCNNYDWHGDRLKYADCLIGEIPSWIKLKKNEFSIAIPQQNVDINTFSDMQAHAYNMVKAHSQHPCPKDQLLLIVVGVAGTGKSYLINAIRNLLGTSCAVTATTGKAAFNINGCTIHSLLKLPIGSRGNKALTGESLVRLQNNLKGISYIIIDEYSMLGQAMLGWIDRRCRQATGKTDEVFGGLSIILVGDPGQLPPVADKPLYHSKPMTPLSEQGHLAYHMFTNVI